MSLFRASSKSSQTSHKDHGDSSSIHSSVSSDSESGAATPSATQPKSKSKWRSIFGSSSSLKQDSEQMKQDKLKQQQLENKLRSQVEHPEVTSQPYSPSQYPVPQRTVSGRRPNDNSSSRRPSAEDKKETAATPLHQPQARKLSPLNIPSSPVMSSGSNASSPGLGPVSPSLTGLGVLKSKNGSMSSISDTEQPQSRPQTLKTSVSNSDLNGALSKLKLMPAVLENHLDDILDEEDEMGHSPKSPNAVMSRGSTRRETHSAASASGELSRSSSKGRSSRLVHKILGHNYNNADSESRDSASPPPFDNEITSRRSNSISYAQLEAHNSHSNFMHTLKQTSSVSGVHRTAPVKTLKRDGCVISYLDGTSVHYHDYCKLKKNYAKGQGGIWGWKRTKDVDAAQVVSIENSISLIPDSYSEQLMDMKAKPENYIWNYEDLEEESGSEDEDEDSEDEDDDADDDDDDEIEPIIGPDQLKMCNSMLDKIEHPDKLHNYIENFKASRLPLHKKYGKIKGLIGKGSYGTVKLAVKTGPDKTESVFAVKHLKQKPNESPHHFGNRVTSEFMIASSLTHQAIINTYDLMIDPQTLTYSQVMEFVPCGDLYSLINSTGGEGLSIVEADCFFKQILNAITYLHSVGISHNDLKVENLLLTTQGQLKIIDFGTSAVFKTTWEPEIQRSKGACGSEPYVAPEEYISDKEYDPRYADIWSVGVIYLIMVNGGYMWSVAKRSDDLFQKYLDTRALYDYTRNSLSHPDEAFVLRPGHFNPIESVNKGQFAHNRRYVLYNMLNPDPEHRMKLSRIWKSEWVKSIHVCDAGRGFLESSINISTVLDSAENSPHLGDPTHRSKSPKASSPKPE